MSMEDVVSEALDPISVLKNEVSQLKDGINRLLNENIMFRSVNADLKFENATLLTERDRAVAALAAAFGLSTNRE